MKLLGALVLFLGFAANSVADNEPPKVKCPETSAQWQTWMEETAHDVMILMPEDPKAIPRPSATIPILSDISRCEASWLKKHGPEKSKPIRACTARMKRFLNRAHDFRTTPVDDLVNQIQGMIPEKFRQVITKRSKSLGFNVTDQSYYAAADQYVSVPVELNNPDFLKPISNPWENDGMKKAKAYLDELNKARLARKEEPIVYFHFDTFLGNFEPGQKTDAGRFFIRFPGNPVKYLQFATHERAGGSGQTSVVAVYKDAKGTLHTYIKDHFRDITADGSVKLRKVEEGIFKGNACINCHQSGPRALAPRNWSKLDKETQDKIDAINQEFAKMEGMEWGGFYDAASMDLGPPLGDDSESAVAARTNEFFDGCTKETLDNTEKYEKGTAAADVRKNKQVVYEKLRSAMSCASCHNGVSRGFIKLPFDRNHTYGRVYSGAMPPGNKLSDMEQRLLAACLKAEMFGFYDSENSKKIPGTVARYLTGQSCEVTILAPSEPRSDGKAPKPGH